MKIITSNNNNLRNRLIFCILIMNFFYFSFSGKLAASPRLITDNRVENLNGFPSLGRGYSIHSNSLQSMCFKKIKKTTPTFDLNYDVDEVTEEFFNDIPDSSKNRLQMINLQSFVRKYFKKEEMSGAVKHTLKNLIVKVEIKSYYYALDETHSHLSESVKQLLNKKQYVTFFNSCGHHYVRSVGSFSTYLALLQFRMSGDEFTDREFVSRLEKGLFNFSGTGGVEKKFEEDAENRGLRVYVKAVGLSKGNMVNLVPVDVEQFRQTVQDAVKLMQDPNSGVISYMEVVPWVENPEFTAFMAKQINDGESQFIRLQKLESNSGVITEINRISNSQVEQFHVATMCQKILFENYVDKTNRAFYENITGQTAKSPTVLYLTDIIDQKLCSYDMEKTLFYNLANENNKHVYLSLREFIEYFAKNPPGNIFGENKKYLYGLNNSPGALDCISKLYSGGLDKMDYRKIPSCVKALKHIKTQANFLEQYCLPKPVKLVFKGKETRTPEKIEMEQPSEPESLPFKKPDSEKKTKKKPRTLEEMVEEDKPERSKDPEKKIDTEVKKISPKKKEPDKKIKPQKLEDLLKFKKPEKNKKTKVRTKAV